MSADFTYNRQGRSWRLAAVLIATWGALLYLWAALDAAPWILGFLALFTLPGLSDLIRNPSTGLSLGGGSLRWHSGRRRAEIPLKEIDHVRLDTRLDFSVRATAVLKRGRRIRLPFESTPPHLAFEEALKDHGVRTERHHFTLMQ